MVAPASVASDPMPAMGSIPVATEIEPPREGCSVDPNPTPFAHAVFPASYEEDGPTSRDLLLDDRIERLLRENLELMKERAAMRSIHQQRIDRCNELLEEARTAKKLVRAYLGWRGESKPFSETLIALKDWAAKTL